MRSPALKVPREQFGVDRSDPNLKFYAPLWHPGLKPSPFYSLDKDRLSCTVTGAVWTPKGRLEDGDDYIELPDNQLTTLANGTIIVWAKPTDAAYGTAYAHECTDDDNRCDLDHTANWRLTWLVGGVGQNAADSGVAATLNVFAHFAVTFGATGLLAYIDGSYVAACSDPTIVTGFDDMGNAGLRGDYIGARLAATGLFIGTIGEVLIYSPALSAVQIQNHRLATMWRYQ